MPDQTKKWYTPGADGVYKVGGIFDDKVSTDYVALREVGEGQPYPRHSGGLQALYTAAGRAIADHVVDRGSTLLEFELIVNNDDDLNTVYKLRLHFRCAATE